MDDLPGIPEPRDSELLDQSPRYLLSDEADGFAIWDLDDDDDEAYLTFPHTEQGEREARKEFAVLVSQARRQRLVPLALLWSAVLSGAAWVFGGLAFAIAYGQQSPSGDLIYGWIRWGQTAVSVAEPVFLVSVGLYFLIWLERRHRR